MEKPLAFTTVSANDPEMPQLACYYFKDSSDAFFYVRPDTYDIKIFEGVAVHNEYNLPERFKRGDVVIDIGAHIGSFSYAALMRGASKVFSYETQPANYAITVKNLGRFGDKAACHHLAVWRSDVDGEVLFTEELDVSEDPNTGGHSVVYNDGGIPVETIGLDEILFELSGGLKRRIRFLKIDCEGAEYPILFTSKYLGKIVDEISGEYHEVPSHIIPPRANIKGFKEFSHHALKSFLETQGFYVDIIPTSDRGGLFHAHRKRLSTSLSRGAKRLADLVTRIRSRDVSKADQPDENLTPQEPIATESDVYYCYRLLLGREPDPGGWRHWTLHIKHNKSRRDLVAALMDSDEFREKWGQK